MADQPRGFHCANCGQQHEAMPDGHVCASCGEAKVVDISDPRHEAMLAILQADTQKRGIADIKLAVSAITVLVLAAVLVTLLVVAPAAKKRAEALKKLRGVRFVSDTIAIDAPVLAGYFEVIRAGAPALVPCWGGELDGSREARVLTLRWTVDGRGGIEGIGATQEVATSVLSCAETVLNGWTFDPPPGGQSLVVEAPLTFTAYKGPARVIFPEAFGVVGTDGRLREPKKE